MRRSSKGYGSGGCREQRAEERLDELTDAHDGHPEKERRPTQRALALVGIRADARAV